MIRRILPPLTVVSRCFVLSLLCSVCALSSRPQGQAAQPTPAGSVRVQHPLVAEDHEQFVAYWTTETGWKSEVQLRNNLPDQNLTVTPALRLPDGTETTLAAVTIKPQEVKSVELDAAISAAAAPQLVGTYGSLVLRYHSEGDRNLYAALMIRNIGHPFAFHIDAISESQAYQAGDREGIWWLPTDKVNDYLIVTNQGKDAIPFVLTLFDSTGRESKQKYVLGPRETARYSVRALVQAAHIGGSYGGIKLSAGTHAGSLDTLHFLFDEVAGFSAILKMFDHDPSGKLEERDFAKTAAWTLRAPMLALTNPDPALAFPLGTTLHPQLFIRNTIDRQVSATLRFNWHDDKQSGSAAGPALKLLPNETRRLDVAALQASGMLPEKAFWTSVTLTTDTAPDEMVAVAASFDESLHYGAQTPFSDQLSYRWEGGMWEYDPYHSSIMSAGNGGTKPTRAALTIFYNQGTKEYELEQTLEPDEQMWVDVGRLIREHVPDKNGKTIPSDVTMGSYEFRDLTGTHAGSLFEGKVIYDKTYGHVSYGCATCCGNGAAYLMFNPLGIPFLPGAGNGVEASDNCGGVDIVTSDFTSWSTASTAIATVNNSGYHSAVAIGSTGTTTTGSLPHTLRYTCPLSPRSASGGDNTKPSVQITGALNFAFVGSDATIPKVLQQAVGKPSGGTYSWTASPTNRISFDNPSADVVNMSGINPSTSVGDTTITVNYTANSQSASPPATIAVTSRIFKFLVLKSSISVPPGSGKYGYDYRLTYDVYTNPGGQVLQPGFSGITVLETVSVVSTNMSGATTHTGGGLTDPNSELGDRLALISNAPIPSGVDEVDSQDLAVGGFFNRNNTLHYTAATVTVTNNGPTS